MKPYSESCDRNRAPILAVLRTAFADRRHVLEIASGTGQHAVYFGAAMPHLRWQASERPGNCEGIRAWRDEANLPNVLAPLALDLNDAVWPVGMFDAVFNANTVHIVSWPTVGRLFEGIGKVLSPGGIVSMYGPFNYGGRFTSESNARFDAWLKARDPASGLRDFEAVDALAMAQGLELVNDIEMPANNRILLWRRTA